MSAFFVISDAKAAVVNCIFSWPQQVVIDGFAHVCGSDRNYCNYDKVGQGIAECCANFPYSDCVKAGPATSYEINTEFPIDAWGWIYDTWSKCENQGASRDQLSAYCKSKGYAKIWPTETNVCYKSSGLERFVWNGAIPMVKGASTGMGVSLTKVKCSNVGYCTENWSCGGWSYCSGGLQTRICTMDANNCGTAADKVTSRDCCTESWSCSTWSSCVGGQQTRTCSDNMNCGTTFSKPAIAQSCGCTPNWSCGSWSTCSNGWQARTCTDSNNCGTTTGKPITAQGCESLSCIATNPAQQVLMYYNAGSTNLFSCNSLYGQCKISGMVGRCCPLINSSNSDCIVEWPRRTVLQGDGAADKKSLTVGETWNVRGGLVLQAISIDAKASPRQVWLTLFKNGVKIDDKVASQGQYYLYSSNYQSYPDFNLFGVYIDSIFAGATSDMVQLRYAYYNSLWESELSNCSENWSCGEWSSCFNTRKNRICIDANNCGTTVTKPTVNTDCTCMENWSCGEWSSCSNSQKTRTCTDSNNCGTTIGKPAASQSCCAENWSCGAWSACFNNQQTRTCADAGNCQTTLSKPAVSQSCSCTESWSCGEWSSCTNDQHSRACLDFNSCGTTANKPVTTQNCAITCAENWSCDSWSSVCVDKKLNRACADLNNCGTVNLKPATAQDCVLEPQIITPTVTSTASATETVFTDAPISVAVNTTNVYLPELEVANPASNVSFGGVTAVSYLPGEVMKFDYKYQNITEKPIKVKIVRQLVNSKGKAVSSVQANKTLKAGAAFVGNIKQVVAKSLPAGNYMVKVKVLDVKNKILDENSFPIELKKKYFVFGELPADTDIAWDAKIWSQVKTNARLPINLKLRFSYINNSDVKQVIKMARELIDENGKVKSIKTSKWVMTVGEKYASTFTQNLSDTLPVGNYTIRIRAYDWASKKLLVENSAGFRVEAK